MACTCIKLMNDRLAEKNGQLVTTIFGEPKAVIGSTKVDSKKRGQPPVAIASFCPFCGVRYGPPPSPEGIS